MVWYTLFQSCLTLLTLLFLSNSVYSYRIFEYSYEEGSGSGDGTNKKQEIWNGIAPTETPKSTQDNFMEQIRSLNPGVIISTDDPDENQTVMPSSPNQSKQQLQEHTCTKNSHCDQGQICNIYTQKCERCRIGKEICRRSENCCGGRKCIWGRCVNPEEDGKEHSLCKDNRDCNAGLCCAREHGQSICKRYLKEGVSCELPEGGLVFSIHHSCPCIRGLSCRVTSHKSKLQRTCVK